MKKITLIGLVVALMALFAGPAAAQDGPTVTADPVAAAGQNDIEVTGAGFSPGIALFVLPCADAGGDIDAFLSNDDPGSLCDTSALTPVTAGDDGGFTATVSYDVPAEGLVFVAGDAAQTEVGVGVITVGDGGGDAAADDAAPAEEEAAPAADLANTGAETGVLVGVGVALLGLGVVSTRAGRRLGDR